MNTQATKNTNVLKKDSPLTIVGQDMHIMNSGFIHAVEHRESDNLAAIAARQVEGGAMALDLHLGTSAPSKNQTAWAVRTIQDAVDVPLFISSHILRQPEILRTCREAVTINSVTAEATTLINAMKTAKEYGSHLVVLLVRPGITPFTVDERLQLASEVLESAVKIGFPIESLYLDPLFHLRPDPLTWKLSRGIPDVDSVLETITMLPQLAGTHVRTLVALSSASQFVPSGERSALHCRLLPMLIAAGLDAVILNCHDKHLMDIVLNSHEEKIEALPLMQQSGANLSQAGLSW